MVKAILSNQDLRYLRLYGITYREYLNMIAAQKGLCAICRKHRLDQVKDLAVDHDHTTGKVRGLLCTNCNTGLGMFKDSIRLLAQAIVYLEDHGKSFDSS